MERGLSLGLKGLREAVAEDTGGAVSSPPEPPEGRERGLYGGEVTSRHQVPGERRPGGIAEQVGWQMCGGAVFACAKRSGCRHGANPIPNPHLRWLKPQATCPVLLSQFNLNRQGFLDSCRSCNVLLYN